MSPVIIPRQVLNQILAHAQSSPEDEICGLISAQDGTPGQCYRIPNTALDSNCRYNMDEKSLIDSMRTMRDRNETLFAIYHSHPHSPAEPSAIDIREAAYPEAIYLIVSLKTKGVLEMKGFRLAQKDAKVEKLELVIE